MAQSTDITLAPGISGTGQRTELNDILAAIITQHSGASRPSYLTGTTGLWMKVVSGTSHELYYFDGTDDILMGTFNLSANTFAASGQLGTFGNAALSKTANFTAVASDFGKIFLCDATTAAFTASLDVTSGLGSSWFVIIQKTDATANAVIIDPNSTDTVNGSTTISLTAQYDSAIVIKTGATTFAAIVTKFPAYASTTTSGVVELATDAEAQAGTDTVRAITPANLQAVTATETRKGVVELATAAEAAAGTDTSRAVTPAGVATAISGLSPASDYQVFTSSGTWTKPSGFPVSARVLIEAWGGGGGGGNNSSSGTNGGSTTIGSLLTARGGTAGGTTAGGAAGGYTATASAGTRINDTGFEGLGGDNGTATATGGFFTGGGGGGRTSTTTNGGNSVYGGGGGAGGYLTGSSGSAGTSQFAGNGGGGSFAGAAPAGGGGGNNNSGTEGGGGGGGSYKYRWLALSSMGATETITIGAGGAGASSAGAGARGEARITVIR